jgi:hypothetical protein
MKSTKKYAGGRKVTPGESQAEARQGRRQNVAHKARFKTGPHARTDANAGRADGPLLPLHQIAVKPRKKAGGNADGE